MEDFEITEIELDDLEEDYFTLAKVEKPKSGKYFRARQKSPGKYDSFRTIVIDKSKGIFAILGISGSGSNKKSEVQSFLFEKDKWTEEEIKSWLEKHKKTTKADLMEDTKKVILEVDGEVVNVDTENEALSNALAAKKISKDKDLMYLKFRFVHSGANSNNDFFDSKDLEERHTTAIYKPLDWEHDAGRIIGSFYDTEFISEEDTEDGRAAVDVYAVMYKYMFPDEAEEIKKRHEKGTLRISMETWFDEAECSVCGEKYDSPIDYCSHLRTRYSVADHKRILRGITFGGGGIVKNPADKNAKSLSLASKADGQELKENVAKREETNRFNTIINEAANLYYNIIYTYSMSQDDKKKKKDRLVALIDDMKMLLDTINVSKIAKGEDSKMSEISNAEVIVALMDKAKADKEAEFKKDLEEQIAKAKEEAIKETKAEYDQKVTELQGSLNEKEEALKTANASLETEKAAKEQIQKDFDEYKNQIEKDKILASRNAILAEKKIVLPEGDDSKNFVLKMTDAEFNIFVEAKAVKEVNDDPTKANAGLEIKDEDKEDKKDKTELISKVLKSL